MLHQPADQFQQSDKPTEFDAAAYVQEMRAAGVIVTPTKNGIELGFALTPAGRGFTDAYSAVARRWHHLISADSHAEFQVHMLLADEIGRPQAVSLVGDDMRKGLIELERLDEEVSRADEGWKAVQDRFEAQFGSDTRAIIEACRADLDYRTFRDAADDAISRHFYLLEHMRDLLIGTTADLAVKVRQCPAHFCDQE